MQWWLTEANQIKVSTASHSYRIELGGNNFTNNQPTTLKATANQ